jgi:hypothetical protein
MKLLLCLDCDDIFNIGYEIKSCNCGATKGKYIDQQNAIYSGVNAIPLGFANNSFANAIRNQSVNELYGERFIAFVVPKECETFIKKDDLNGL